MNSQRSKGQAMLTADRVYNSEIVSLGDRIGRLSFREACDLCEYLRQKLAATGAVPRRIALGFDFLLDSFARENNAEMLKIITRDDPDPSAWRWLFLEMLSDSITLFLFNLTGLPADVLDSVSRVVTGRSTGYTEWELTQIYLNPDCWPRVSWYRDGAKVEKPF